MLKTVIGFMTVDIRSKLYFLGTLLDDRDLIRSLYSVAEYKLCESKAKSDNQTLSQTQVATQ